MNLLSRPSIQIDVITPVKLLCAPFLSVLSALAFFRMVLQLV